MVTIVEQKKTDQTLPVRANNVSARSNTEKQAGEASGKKPPSSSATPVNIYLRGIQTVDGEQDLTELFTYGTVYQKNGKYYLVYEEPGHGTEPGTVTTLKMEGNHKISLTRRGGTKSSLIIERGVRNVGFYSTAEGNFTIGVSAAEIKVELTPTGGTIYFKYALDINTAHMSHHEVLIQLVPL